LFGIGVSGIGALIMAFCAAIEDGVRGDRWDERPLHYHQSNSLSIETAWSHWTLTDASQPAAIVFDPEPP